MSRDNFLQTASKQTGLPVEEVQKLLREKFGKFKADNTGKYMVYLRQCKAKELDEKIEAKETRCPYHDAKTFGTMKWYGHWTKIPSWRCEVGGERCFLRAKMDGFLEVHGIKIDWNTVDLEAQSNG